jgi:GDP-D-mannose dehydratase
VYNLAAQSHVKVSFEMPEYFTEVELLLGECHKVEKCFTAGNQKLNLMN